MMSPVADGDSRGSETIKTLGLVVGLLAGVVGLLYAMGGGVLMLRLYLEDLPSLTVVGQLPREFLISTALSQIVLPALVVSAVYVAVRFLLGSSARPPKKLIHQWSRGSTRGWFEVLAASVSGALALTLIGAIPAFVRKGLTQQVIWLLVVSLVLMTIVVLVALRLRASVAIHYRLTWHELRPVALMAFILALTVVPACVLFAGTFHLLDAKVCTTEKLEENGVLVGQTDGGVLIGDARGAPGEPRRVVSIPADHVQKLVIGGDAEEASCGPPQP
jgi:hypothetical protein